MVSPLSPPIGACQAPNLPMGPRPRNRLVTACCWAHSVTWVPVTASHCSHSALCHFQVSSHCWWVPFCHRFAVWPSHCCCLHRHTVAPHSGFWPRDCPNE
ncbi:unnamed protein product [Staurois parvus]|uniref:Uncharacterized protein n=1 Tax=Staurois parvus TaxID=386267 RepID=A0ABN9FR70_9NEOB|nr:unnamed protein product [Staurois parvus]